MFPFVEFLKHPVDHEVIGWRYFSAITPGNARRFNPKGQKNNRNPNAVGKLRPSKLPEPATGGNPTSAAPVGRAFGPNLIGKPRWLVLTFLWLLTKHTAHLRNIKTNQT